ncbi:MAG: TolC family protein [Planctomycetota bacterium]
MSTRFHERRRDFALLIPAVFLSGLLGQDLHAQEEPSEATPVPESGPTGPQAGSSAVTAAESIDEPTANDPFRTEGLPREPLELSLSDALRIGRGRNLDLKAEELTQRQTLQTLRQEEAAFETEFFASFDVGRSEDPPRNIFSPALTRETVGGSVGFRQRIATGAQYQIAYTPSRLIQATNTPGFPTQLQTNLFELRVTQPLLRGAWGSSVLANVRANEAALAGDTARFERTVQDTLLSIVQAYWELVFAREDYAVRVEGLRLAQEQLRITEERIRVRQLAPRDRVSNQADIARRREELIRARNEIRRRQDELAQLLFDGTRGELWNREIVPVSPIETEFVAPDLDWQLASRGAIERRPDLVALREDVRQAEVRLEQARSDLLPQFDFTGVFGTAGVQPTLSDSFTDAVQAEFPNWSLGFELSIPVGNHAARAARNRALLAAEQARRRLYASEIQVVADVRLALRDLATFSESINAGQLSVQLAETQLDTEQQRQRVGRTTQFEVQQRNQELLEARQQLLRNQLDYRVAESRLLHAEGRLAVDDRNGED